MGVAIVFLVCFFLVALVNCAENNSKSSYKYLVTMCFFNRWAWRRPLSFIGNYRWYGYTESIMSRISRVRKELTRRCATYIWQTSKILVCLKQKNNHATNINNNNYHQVWATQDVLRWSQVQSRKNGTIDRYTYLQIFIFAEAIKNLGYTVTLQQIMEAEAAEFYDSENVQIGKTDLPSLSVWKVNEPAEQILAKIQAHFSKIV